MKPLQHSSLILPQIRATLLPRGENPHVAKDIARANELLLSMRLQLSASLPLRNKDGNY